MPLFTNLQLYNDNGSILYPGLTQVSMDEIFTHSMIGKNYVQVYFNEIDTPPPGVGLNRPAIITLKCSCPIEHCHTSYNDYLRKIISEMDAKFICYDSSSGVCHFEVEHFTRYGLVNDSFNSVVDEPINLSFESMTVETSEIDEILEPSKYSLDMSQTIQSVKEEFYLKNDFVEEAHYPQRKPLPSLQNALYKGRKLMIADIGTLFSRSFGVCFGLGDKIIVPTKNIKTDGCDKKIIGPFEGVFDIKALGDKSMNHQLKFYEIRSKAAICDVLPILELLRQFSYQGVNDTQYTLTNPHVFINELNKMNCYCQEERLLAMGLLPILWPSTCDKTDSKTQKETLFSFLKSFMSDHYISSPDNEIGEILQLFASLQVEKACEMAMNNNLHRLALLMSNGCGSRQEYMRKQVITWIEETPSVIFDDDIERIYLIMAGLLSVKVDDDRVINACDSCNWLQCFAVLLFYFGESDVSVKDVAIQYLNIVNCDDYGFAKPYSNIKSNGTTYSKIVEMASRTQYLISFSLIMRFSQLKGELSDLLSPLNNSNDVKDYSFSWIIAILLVALNVVSEEKDLVIVDDCTIRFAAQLEEGGYWEWAVYVSLFINNHQTRMVSIESILYANVQLCENGLFGEKEKFIMSIGVPSRIVYQALVCSARQANLVQSEIYFLLMSEQYVRAQQLLMNRGVASQLFATGNKHILKKYMEIIYSHVIPNYSTNLGLFHEYFSLFEQETITEDIFPRILKYSKVIANINLSTNFCRITQTKIASTILKLVNQHRTKSTSNIINEIIALLPLTTQDIASELLNTV